jgi:putative membrane protein
MMMWFGGGAVAMAVQALIGLVFVGSAVAAVIAVWRLTSRGGSWPGASPDGGSTARRLLDERYARGDLDDDEYRRRRDRLGGW